MESITEERIQHVKNAIEHGETVRFTYGHETIREIKPTGFFADSVDDEAGFEGNDIEIDEPNFRRFKFDRIETFYDVVTLSALESAWNESRGITHDAKHLDYPVNQIQLKLSNLAEKVGLEEEMKYYLDEVSEANNKLQSAFFRCDEVFQEAISEEELKSYVDQ